MNPSRKTPRPPQPRRRRFDHPATDPCGVPRCCDERDGDGGRDPRSLHTDVMQARLSPETLVQLLRELSQPWPLAEELYDRSRLAELPAFVADVCNDPQTDVLAVRHWLPRATEPVVIARRLLRRDGARFGGLIQHAPFAASFDVESHLRGPKVSDASLGPATAGAMTYRDYLCRCLGVEPPPSSHRRREGAPPSSSSSSPSAPPPYMSLLSGELMMLMLTHRYVGGRGSVGLYEVLGVSADDEQASMHDPSWIWCSGWLLPSDHVEGWESAPTMKRLGGAPSPPPSHPRPFFCVYGGQA